MKLTFTRYSLANGITLIVKENHHAQSVVIRGRLEGGANWDPPEKAGLASFSTGLMRRGTNKRTFAQINDAVEAIAASVYVSCGRHLTAFGGKSLAEDFDLLVELMTDNLLAPTFLKSEMEKLRGQIITNLNELEDSPRGLAHRHFRQVLYGPNHPYGRPFNGTFETVAKIARPDLLEFYRRLHPRNGVVIVVGDVESEAVYDTMEAVLGQWQPDGDFVPPELPALTPLTEVKRYVHPMPNKSQADLMLGNIGPGRSDKNYYAAYVADTILGHLGLGGRIGQVVRDKEGLAYYARTSLSAGLGPTPWYIYAGVNPENVDKTVDLILNEIRCIRETPVTGQELADTKAYVTGVLPLQMETNEGVASTLLDIYLFQLEDDFVAQFPAIINAISKTDVQNTIRKYLSDQIYTLTVAGPYQEKNVD